MEARKKSPRSTQAKAAKRDEMADGPRRDAIALRAYQLFLARGGEPGRDQDDWYSAERELQRGFIPN